MVDPLSLAEQLAKANAILEALQLPEGLKLAGDALIKDDQIVVPVANDPEGRSELVPLETLTGSSGNHFNVPSAFRTPSLNASFDPTNSDNLDEILRQLASDDATQRRAGYEALEAARAEAHRRGPEAEAEFESRVTEARQRVTFEHPEEAPQVEQTYQEYRSGHYEVPAGAQVSNGGGNPGAAATASGGSGVAAPVVAGGSPSGVGGTAVVVGSADVGVMLAGLVPGVLDGTLLTTASLVPASILPVGGSSSSLPLKRTRGEDGIEVPVPAPIYFTPVTVSFQSKSLPATIGDVSIPGQGGEFFQNQFFSPNMPMNDDGASPVVAFLTQSTEEARPYIESVRQATEALLRNYWTQPRIGAWSVESAHRPIAVEYRYDSAARGIVVSIVPSGARPARDGNIFDDVHDDSPASPFDRIRRFTGVSLASFRVGVDGVTREPDIMTMAPSTTVLIPFAVFAGVRVATDVRVNPGMRPNGAATDQAPARITQRGNSSDQRGSNGRGDSKGGRGRGQDRGKDQQPQDQPEDEVFVAA